MPLLEAAMWTPEDRVLVGDFGSDQALSDGPQGGTSGTYIPKFLETLNIKATLSHGDWSSLAEQMQQKQIDALAVASGVPFPAFAQIEAKSKVTIRR
jgi:TRAP-type uncharacterized transport system substrate-binding protein